MNCYEVEILGQHKAMVLNHSKGTDESPIFHIQFSGVPLTLQTSDVFWSDNTNQPPTPQTQGNTDNIL